ncbi:unnamed protein product [Somion occarium]|uniref:Uncharacterized protein n=1 Tax=Somion occarium TaxID=3059160 RepID=A0ABP1DXE3_9APHY
MQTWDRAFLNKAIVLYEEAMALYPSGDPDRPQVILKLAGALQVRHLLFHDMEPLERSLSLHRSALDDVSDEDRATYVCELAEAYHLKLRYTRRKEDVEVAVTLGKQALNERYKQYYELPSAEQALKHLEVALELCLPHDTKRLDCLDALGQALAARCEHSNSSDDLESGINLLREASKSARSLTQIVAPIPRA